MSNHRWLRRMCGFLNARVRELQLGEIIDPRKPQGRRWKLEPLMQALLVGLMNGRRNLREVEALTEEMSPAARKLTGIERRVPDTTLWHLVSRLDLDALRGLLRRAAKLAWRRKSLERDGLPFHVVSMDGKATALPDWDQQYAQLHHREETGHTYGLLRTVTACLISTRAKPCLDVMPIPAQTNENGFFATAFSELLKNFGKLFQVVVYDAGALAEANADAVVAAGKRYVFRLKAPCTLMLNLAKQMLERDREIVAETVDVINNHKTVTRRLYLAKLYELKRADIVWKHARSFVRVESITEVDGSEPTVDNRYYVTNLRTFHLTGEQWLRLIRGHWAVENNCHHTFDTAFREDEKPWIRMDAAATLNVLVLRRMAYTLMTLFRSVTLRAEDKRSTPWKDLMRRLYNAVIAATEVHIRGLRLRSTATV